MGLRFSSQILSIFVGSLARAKNESLEAVSAEMNVVDLLVFQKTAHEIAIELQTDHPAVHVIRTNQRGRYGFLEYLFRSSKTLRQAVGLLPKFGILFNDLADFTVANAPDGQEVHYRIRGQREGLGQHGNEYAVLALVQLARECLGVQWRPDKVWFSHCPEGDGRELEEFLGVTPVYNAPTSGLLLDSAVLDRELPASEPALNELLMAHLNRLLPEAGRPTFVARVERALNDALASRGEPILDVVSQGLGMSGRTLQRRLGEYGIAFQELLDSVRSRRARELLSDKSLPLSEVAYQLGYAELSPFVRAFRRWHQATPWEYRESAHANQHAGASWAGAPFEANLRS